MKISVVTVCLNAAPTIRETLESVASQDVGDFEYIVIDGGSTDGTLDIIREYEDVISLLVSEPDQGLYDAMNKGISMASGAVIGFLNADDRFAKADVLREISNRFVESSPDAVVGDVAIVASGNGNSVRRLYSSGGFQNWQFRVGHAPPHPGAYIRREALIKLGGFDDRFRICADFDLLLRFFQKRPIVAYVPRVFVMMRAGGVSTFGFWSTVKINREKRDICRKNGVATSIVFIWAKYLLKGLQFVSRPRELIS